MRIRIVSLAGKRGSGKSTIATALERHGFARAAFGNFVRRTATERDMDQTVPALEALGNKLIGELGWDRFCREVLAGTELARRVVVDGVRHTGARDALQRLVHPDRAALVFVELDEATRVQRLLSRRRPGEDPSAPEMSLDLDRLRSDADLIVDGSGHDAATRIVAWIESVEAHD